MPKPISVEVAIVGGGLAGLSAAIYLGRALRETVIVDSDDSLASFEPDVQNYLGFPRGISGQKLLKKGRAQAKRFGVKQVRDRIEEARLEGGKFILKGSKQFITSERLLLATGLFHLPPEVPHVDKCIGHSLFFCKDCDGHRVQEKSIAVVGSSNHAVKYALQMLVYSPMVCVTTNGQPPRWDSTQKELLEEYKIPVYTSKIQDLELEGRKIKSVVFANGDRLEVEYLFTTLGDVYHHQLAQDLGARLDLEGQICVDEEMRTTIPGLYAAGCVTPANCQMIIAAGQGATAAQAINLDLFEASLKNHALRRFRQKQVATEEIKPRLLEENVKVPPEKP